MEGIEKKKGIDNLKPKTKTFVFQLVYKKDPPEKRFQSFGDGTGKPWNKEWTILNVKKVDAVSNFRSTWIDYDKVAF